MKRISPVATSAAAARTVRRHLSYANVATMALFLALSGGVAVAITGIPDAEGTITGCYNTTNGELCVVADAHSCRNTERALPWNQTGPKGVDGAPRREGREGRQGRQGRYGH